MATQERLMKSLDTLRSLLSSNVPTDTAAKKKEKILHCNIIGDAMCNCSVKVALNFLDLLSYSVEILLQLCDDPESDVRMIADETLNRIIRAMINGNIIKVHSELLKEIQKNGSARSLRAALWRFAQLCYMIRPHKGKAYVKILIPNITKIIARAEESLHETLANSLPKIMDALGSFTTDNDVKCWLKAFLQNISNPSAVIRRTAASCIFIICIKCRKPQIFITYILNTLLDLLLPVSADHSTSLILGVFGCLRNILPHVKQTSGDQELKGSFGVKRSSNDNVLSPSRMLQVYELCLHYASHLDHNVVNAALESLNTFLQNAPPDLIKMLMSPDGISTSYILATDGTSRLTHRSLSQISIATTKTLADDTSLVDSEVTEIKTNIEKWIESSKLPLSTETIEPVFLDTSISNTSDLSANNVSECEYSNIYIGTIVSSLDVSETDIPDANIQKVESLDEITSEKSSPKITVSVADYSNILYQDVDIGCFTGPGISLEYCCRFIAKSFLLTGHPNNLIPDKSVRISVKSLALSCISTIVQYHPNVLFLYLHNSCAKSNNESAKNDDKQQISDILLFSNHADPQLRGTVSCIVGNFIKAVLLHNESDYEKCFINNPLAANSNVFQLKYLIQMLVKGLQDESSTCSRLSLIAVGACLSHLIESVNSSSVLPILKLLPTLVKNPYWLVKVKLIEIICEIPFVTLHYVTDSSEFQDKVIHNIVFTLLKDEDQRVRHATASALVRIIPNLYNSKDIPNHCITTRKGLYYKNKYLSNMFNISLEFNVYESKIMKNLPKPFNTIGSEVNMATEQSLSRIITYLSQHLLNPTSKYTAYGSSEALYLLANEYPCTEYCEAWACAHSVRVRKASPRIFERSISQGVESPVQHPEAVFSSAAGLLNTCVTLLTTTTFSHDIACHQWLLSLAGNVFSGVALHNLKSAGELTPEETTKTLWNMYNDKCFADVVEQFLHHIVRLLNIFCHIIGQVLPTLPQTKPVLPNLPTASSLSPIKRRSKSDVKHSSEKDDKTDKKGENIKFNEMGYFANLPHYMKIYEILRMAYTNYKITLDSDASEKFLRLLKTTLETLSQVLEMASVYEMGRIPEELLNYLRSTMVLEPTSTVHCVLQLLKCLFGTNLCFQINDIAATLRKSNDHSQDYMDKSSFFYHIFQSTYEKLTKDLGFIKPFDKYHSVLGYMHRKDRKHNTSFKSLSRSVDTVELASYIRLFEPMVIKALKQYTITSDVRLQCKVLQLLCHLVQLKVNYCLLDSDQIFINYVLNQFEFIEEGQISLAEELIPRMFQFLVYLSYEKQHSKSIIGVPKIINLCDRLMASGQSPVTHFIPAIIPVIEDIFIFRNTNNIVRDVKELETTRDVLFSKLLQLIEYPEVIQLLALVVNESRYCNDNSERWNRWSERVADILLSALAQNRVRLDCSKSQTSVYNLIVSLNPVVFKPINDVLKVLFSEPPPMCATTKEVNYWLGMVLTLFLTISQVKEEVLLMRIGEVKLEFAVRAVFDLSSSDVTTDPLNVSSVTHNLKEVPSAEIFARFILRVVSIACEACIDYFNEEGNCDNYIFEQFSMFLMYCIHMFQSGSHCKIGNAAIQLLYLQNAENMNKMFLKLAPFCPTLTLEWCYVLTLLNYSDTTFWSTILQTPKCDGIVHLSPDSLKTSLKSTCMNLEIVKIGGIILYCDYLCENVGDAEQLTWMLVNHIEYVVRLSDEMPVSELIATVHRNSAASGLFIQAIGARCQDIVEPCFIDKLLRCVENAHPSQSGALLLLLIPRLLNCRQLSLSRFASSLASRRTEHLLTITPEEVNEQLPKDDLNIVINSLLKAKIIKKHETLVSLLNRLGSKCYDLSPIEFDQRRTLNPENIKNIVINKSWYLSQVKNHCNQTSYVGKESAELLNKLEYEDILSIMSNVDFNHCILKDCIMLVKRCDKVAGNEEVPLLKATVITLLNHITYMKSLIPKPHQVYKATGRDVTPSEAKYVKRLGELFSDSTFWQTFCKLIPTVTCYLESLPELSNIRIPDNHFEDCTKFGVLCLESLVYKIISKDSLTPNYMDMVLGCVSVIFKQNNFCSILGLDSFCSWLCSAVNCVYYLVEYLLLNNEPLPSVPLYGLKPTLENMETLSAGHACYQLGVLVTWIEKIQNTRTSIPKYLLKPIKCIIISLARLPLVNSYVLTPPTAWQQGWQVELSGTFSTQVPPLPIEFLQEIDVLEEFIFRITLLGWTSRQQFEETWMCLLSVLSASPTEDRIPDEIASIVHSTSLAVQAITTLLLQTLLVPIPGDPHVSQLIHVARDTDIDCTYTTFNKLKLVHENLYQKYKDYSNLNTTHFALTHVFQSTNFERKPNRGGYGYSQLSIEYLWIAAKIAQVTNTSSTANEAFMKRQKYLNESGLDLHSCLQFLLDLYTQWIKAQNNTSLRLLHEVVKSVLVLSDIFTEKSQFTWMLDMFLNLCKVHPPEDEVLHQYLVIGVCKATAVLTPDLETYDTVKKLVAASLKSGFLPSRIASLHGILYLLQSSVIGNTVIGGLSEETQLIHPVAIEYVQHHINNYAAALSQSEEHQLTMWSLAFFLLEHVEEQITDTDVPSVLQVALAQLSHHSVPLSIHNALMQGLERLIIKKCISGKVLEQVTKIALEKLKNTNPNYALPGLQLLLTCMYMGSQEQLNTDQITGVAQSDPELFVQMIEKTSAIFDRVKISCLFEVELLCSVLPNILNDFFPPSEILTKVIGEFLSPQQPHPKILSGVVFLVFERACDMSQLLLLQDWVVCSLSNFTQSLPVNMATWCLTCFFISASTNRWVRSLFPYVQSRIGRYEYEDKKILCIAAADFYRSLSNDSQRKSFVETFQKVKDIPDTPFKDLIACL